MKFIEVTNPNGGERKLISIKNIRSVTEASDGSDNALIELYSGGYLEVTESYEAIAKK
jgi:hypothetical protein